MKRLHHETSSTNVSAPLSSDELDVLTKFATNTIIETITPVERVNAARTMQVLVRKGWLQKSRLSGVTSTAPSYGTPIMCRQ